MRSIVNNSFQFPGRSPRLNVAHPAFRGGAARLAAVSRTDGSMFDLVTNRSRGWTGALGKNTSIGPVAYPNGVATGGILWPAIIPNEVFPALTMAAIWQQVASLHGQGIVTIAPAAPAQITIQSTGIPNWGQQGVLAFNNMPVAVAGHTYFFVASVFAITPKPRSIGTLLDMTTGQIWIGKDPGNNFTASTSGTSYTTLTYTGGTPDSNFVACAMIAATTLTQGQQLDCCSDPWGFWFDRTSLDLMRLAVVKPSAIIQKANPASLLMGV